MEEQKEKRKKDVIKGQIIEYERVDKNNNKNKINFSYNNRDNKRVLTYW